MLLLDTNIWLELLLGQQRSVQVSRLLAETPPPEIHITDFSLYSIGIILARTGRLASLSKFLDDVTRVPGVQLVRLDSSELRLLPAVCHKFGIDFDDAYQYVAATFRGLSLYSFDRHFDRTDVRRQEP